MNISDKVEQALGVGIQDLRPLSGGCIGEVYGATLADGRRVVVKAGTNLDVEGYMLGYLAAHSALPVPKVHHSTPALLIMDYVAGDSRFSGSAEKHAAELLAALHEVRGPGHGLERDTLIGSLHQPNPWTESWVDFFREHRLLALGIQARDAGRMPKASFQRLETFCVRLEEFLEEPPYPSLLHGDVWTTNVLAQGNHIAAFLDPAVYYGHPEIELAFITLFSTFGQAFFDHYNHVRPIRPGFFENRRDIYNLYPLLVHTRLFGGGYLHSVEHTLDTLGF